MKRIGWAMAGFCRFLALLAVLLMPFGMATAPAAPIHHQQMMAAPMTAIVPTGHCPDEDSRTQSNGVLADCTMACAAALPAADLPSVEPHATSQSMLTPSLERELFSIDLDIATPPPRLS